MSWATQVHAQNYDAGRAAAQRASGGYGRSAQRYPTSIHGGYRGQTPQMSQSAPQGTRAAYSRSINAPTYQQVSRPTGYRRPSGEVRGNDIVQPVRYQAEVAPQETIVGPEVPVMPEGMPAQPVEVIEDGATYYEGGMEYEESFSNCSNCSTSGGGICDPGYRSKGCDREKCPCPSDEALSYYRCNHYGHYPTLWRTWPEGFLKYRPEPQDTMYDRFRKAPKGMDKADGGKRDEDLDKQLKDLLKEQEGTKGKKPSAGPSERPAPDLLPDDPPTDAAPGPGPKDGSYFRRQPVQSPHAVRPVGWNR